MASHRAAARLHRLDGFDGEEVLEVSVPSKRRSGASGLVVHRVAALEPRTSSRVNGLPTTGLARTLVDLGSVCPAERVHQALDDAASPRGAAGVAPRDSPEAASPRSTRLRRPPGVAGRRRWRGSGSRLVVRASCRGMPRVGGRSPPSSDSMWSETAAGGSSPASTRRCPTSSSASKLTVGPSTRGAFASGPTRTATSASPPSAGRCCTSAGSTCGRRTTSGGWSRRPPRCGASHEPAPGRGSQPRAQVQLRVGGPGSSVTGGGERAFGAVGSARACVRGGVRLPACGRPAERHRALAEGINRGDRFQTLLGITGSGKSATIAWTIEQVQRPTLVLAPNKSLAAQLANGVQGVLPGQPGGVLRQLLRLLPARGLHRLERHVHREGQLDQRRDRPAAPLGHRRRCSPAGT